jgi:nitronate monooxygenase
MAITQASKPEHVERVVLANFVEVFLAKAGHSGLVGINLLEKIQAPNLASLYGAMLAGVDFVLMGAGIPREIPGVLDRFADSETARLSLHVDGAPADKSFHCEFAPASFTGGEVPWLQRPKFLAIVSSATLATMLARKSNGRVDGFIVEGPTAGGHNAPPRGGLQLDERCEPIYGPRDQADLEAFRKLEVPFWLAGSYGSPDQVASAIRSGATGVQVGTAFAFCEESGLAPELKSQVIALAKSGATRVHTDPAASPTGFPFKIIDLPGTGSDPDLVAERVRRCDLGYLRQPYCRPDGTIGWRCPSEPVEQYVKKQGKQQDTVGRKCICNGLMATVGLAQFANGANEFPLVTCGNDVANIHTFLSHPELQSYSASEVIQHLLCRPQQPAHPIASVSTASL